MVRAVAFTVLALVVPLQVSAHETIRLHNGYSFEADSHREEQGVVLISMGSGTVQIAKEEIKEIQISADEPKPQSLVVSNATAESVEDILRRAARAQGIDEAFVRSVAKIESGLRQNAISPKGARGLMQLMPGTAAQMKIDAFQTNDNALGGALYLRQLLLQFKGDSALALAAYNAGPGAVARFKGIPPYSETRNYILRVLAEYKTQLRVASNSSIAVHKPGTAN